MWCEPLSIPRRVEINRQRYRNGFETRPEPDIRIRIVCWTPRGEPGGPKRTKKQKKNTENSRQLTRLRDNKGETRMSATGTTMLEMWEERNPRGGVPPSLLSFLLSSIWTESRKVNVNSRLLDKSFHGFECRHDCRPGAKMEVRCVFRTDVFVAAAERGGRCGAV